MQVHAHLAPDNELLVELDQELTELGLPPEVVEAGLAAGAPLDLDTVVAEIFDGKW